MMLPEDWIKPNRYACRCNSREEHKKPSEYHMVFIRRHANEIVRGIQNRGQKDDVAKHVNDRRNDKQYSHTYCGSSVDVHSIPPSFERCGPGSAAASLAYKPSCSLSPLFFHETEPWLLCRDIRFSSPLERGELPGPAPSAHAGVTVGTVGEGSRNGLCVLDRQRVGGVRVLLGVPDQPIEDSVKALVRAIDPDVDDVVGPSFFASLTSTSYVTCEPLWDSAMPRKPRRVTSSLTTRTVPTTV